MYTDPTQIRDIVIKVRLNAVEKKLLEAVTEYTGQQISTLMRELFLEQAALVLSGQGDVRGSQHLFQEPQSSSQMSR